MTDKEAKDRLISLRTSYKIRIEEEDIEALDKGIEALENQKNIIKELEKMKAKIEQMDFDLGDYYDHTDTIIEMVSNVIDKQIEELKGE